MASARRRFELFERLKMDDEDRAAGGDGRSRSCAFGAYPHFTESAWREDGGALTCRAAHAAADGAGHGGMWGFGRVMRLEHPSIGTVSADIARCSMVSASASLSLLCSVSVDEGELSRLDEVMMLPEMEMYLLEQPGRQYLRPRGGISKDQVRT